MSKEKRRKKKVKIIGKSWQKSDNWSLIMLLVSHFNRNSNSSCVITMKVWEMICKSSAGNFLFANCTCKTSVINVLSTEGEKGFIWVAIGLYKIY